MCEALERLQTKQRFCITTENRLDFRDGKLGLADVVDREHEGIVPPKRDNRYP